MSFKVKSHSSLSKDLTIGEIEIRDVGSKFVLGGHKFPGALFRGKRALLVELIFVR